MNTQEFRSGLHYLVKTAGDDGELPETPPKVRPPQPAPVVAPPSRTYPGLNAERAKAFLLRDLPMSVIPMGLGMAAGEGIVRTINNRMLASGQPMPTAWRYGIPIGAAGLTILGNVAGRLHSKILSDRARAIPGPESPAL